jgi:hypothetical protein
VVENVPVPLPTVTFVPVLIGSDDVEYKTPRSVTVAPPSLVTFPPVVADVWVIAETLAVVTTGRVGFFSQELRHSIELIARIAIAGIFNIWFMKVGF